VVGVGETGWGRVVFIGVGEGEGEISSIGYVKVGAVGEVVLPGVGIIPGVAVATAEIAVGVGVGAPS